MGLRKELKVFIFLFLVLGVIGGVNATGDINFVCQDNDFDFGVTKWECESNIWSTIIGDFGTSVTGTCDVADWSVGSSGADGIVVKYDGSNSSSIGTEGTENPAQDISNIVFCGFECTSNEDCVDDLFCNGEETCVNNECVDGTSVVCDDPLNEPSEVCWEDTGVCNEETDMCDYTFVDNDGPETSDLIVTKTINACNIDITATETDICSFISEAEYFLGGATCGTPGTGLSLSAVDGNFDDELVEAVLKNSAGNSLQDGSLNVHVRGKDILNNWGDCETVNIALDCLPPEYPTCEAGDDVDTERGIALNGVCNPNELLVCGNNPSLTANVCDKQSTIQLAEYFIDEDNPFDWGGIEMDAVDGEYLDENCEDVEAEINLDELSEGTHYVQLHGKDSQETWGKLDQPANPLVSFIKDTTPPRTTKEIDFFNDAYFNCQMESANGHDLTDGCYYVLPGTTITLSATDPDPQGTEEFAGDVIINWEVWYSQDCTVNEPVWTLDSSGQGLLDQDVMITLEQDSCHLIKYWASDGCVNLEEPHYELDIVDSQAPETTKTITGPQVLGDNNPIHNYITDETTITLNCEDSMPHPVNDVTLLHWELWYNGQSNDCDDVDWGVEPIMSNSEEDGSVEISDLRDSCHKLVYWCEDALGNTEEQQVEIDAVDNQEPEVMKEIVGPSYAPEGSQCPPRPGTDDVCYIDGVTEIHVSVEDPSPHPVDDVTCRWGYTVNDEQFIVGGQGLGDNFIVTFSEESRHNLIIECKDALGNRVHDEEMFIVDKTPPVTQKSFEGPQFTCYDWCWAECYSYGSENPGQECLNECLNGEDSICEYVGDQEQYEYEGQWFPMWVSSNTEVVLNAQDQEPHPSGIQATYWRTTLVENGNCWSQEVCQQSVGEGEWMTYNGEEFNGIEDESCHLIEYYSVDNVEKTETVKKQCVFVDNTEPTTDKTVGEPRFVCERDSELCGPESVPQGEWTPWFVTDETPIILTCADQEPHPVDHESLCFRISWHVSEDECWDNYGSWDEVNDWCWLTDKYGEYFGDNEVVDEFYCVDLNDFENNEFEFHFLEESLHNIEWFCEDALGNDGELNVEWDNVDLTPPKIIIRNPNINEREIEMCVQKVVASINDEKSGLLRAWAELWTNPEEGEGVMMTSVDLSLTSYGTWEGTMDKDFPAGEYLLKVCAEDNLENVGCEEIVETLLDGVFVEYITPAVCGVDPEEGGVCDFSYHICMRGDNSIKFWLNKIEGLVTPGDMEATITNPDTGETAVVGLRHESGLSESECLEVGDFWDSETRLCWFISEAEFLQLSCEEIVGRTEFELHLELDAEDMSAIGPGAHDLEYWIQTLTNVCTEPEPEETHVVINEFLSNAVDENQEWIELYNPTSLEIGLTGWTISDNFGENSLDGFTIPSEGYLLLEKEEGDFTLALSNSEDLIMLKNGLLEVDKVTYGESEGNAPAPSEGQSTGRSPDGQDTDTDNVDFVIFGSPTPGAANSV